MSVKYIFTPLLLTKRDLLGDPVIVSANGKAEIEITYVDIGIAPTGIDVVKINWGNNMTVNATGLSSLNFQYTKNGV